MLILLLLKQRRFRTEGITVTTSLPCRPIRVLLASIRIRRRWDNMVWSRWRLPANGFLIDPCCIPHSPLLIHVVMEPLHCMVVMVKVLRRPVTIPSRRMMTMLVLEVRMVNMVCIPVFCTFKWARCVRSSFHGEDKGEGKQRSTETHHF